MNRTRHLPGRHNSANPFVCKVMPYSGARGGRFLTTPSRRPWHTQTLDPAVPEAVLRISDVVAWRLRHLFADTADGWGGTAVTDSTRTGANRTMEHVPARILVVDDEPDYAATLALALRANGHDVDSCARAEDALELVSSPSRQPFDLLITDIVMPGMSGEDLVAAVRRTAPDLPILAMTSCGNTSLLVQLMRLGCSDYIDKPFSPRQLEERVRSLLQRRSGALAGQQSVERLAALGSNVAGLVHDLNNQLAAMSGFRELLEQELSDPRQLQYCGSIRRCLYRVGNMVNSVMAVAGAAAPRMVLLEPVSVRDLVENIVALSNLRTSVSIDIHPNCAVEAERERLETVFWNLLKNADEALRGSPDGRIVVSCGLEGESVVVSVRDNGPGISPEVRDKLFGVGQTWGKRNGNGIGLHSSRRVVEGMGGALWCESEPGSGATFFVRLPFRPPQLQTGSGSHKSRGCPPIASPAGNTEPGTHVTRPA